MSVSAHPRLLVLGLFVSRRVRYLDAVYRKTCASVQIKWAFLHKAAVVSQVSAGVDLETGTTEEKNNVRAGLR